MVNKTLSSGLMGTELEVTIRMNGLSCMYAFCAAVVLSLIVGIACDMLDDSFRRKHEVRPRLTVCTPAVGERDPTQEWHMGGIWGLGMLRSPKSFVHLFLLLVMLGLEIAIATTPIIDRYLGGGMGLAIEDAGYDFTRGYTVLEMANLLGSFGGWNVLKSVVMYMLTPRAPMGLAAPL